MAKSVIIIGAGLGGLTAAALLAHRGFDVTLLEKNAQSGGKVFEYRAGGFRWDIAPASFAPKWALEKLFADLDLALDHYLRLQPIDPQTRYFFPDGEVFDAQRDWAALTAEINRIAPGDYIGFLNFLAYAARLESPFDAATDSLPFGRRRNMRQAIARYIKSSKLQQILASFAASAGGSAHALPAAFNTLSHQAISGGLWYPQDGMASLASALERLAREQGAAIHLNSPVSEIRLKGNVARGITLADGQELTADALVANVDAISTQRFLLPDGALPTPALRRLNRVRMSSSAFVVMLGVRGRFPQLAHHNLFFAADRGREHDDIFRREVMPEEPTISLTISSKTDPLSAPVNQENWLIKVEAPPLSEKFDWAAEREKVRDRLLALLNERYGLDLTDRIRIEQQLTPADFKAISGAWRGALFGRSAHIRGGQSGAASLRDSHFSGLYYAGSTTRPGGDNAFGIHSGRLAAQAIADDLG